MAVPLAELERLTGDRFNPASGRWSALAARYNYGCRLPDIELTAAPELSVENFHRYEEYAPLRPER